MHQETKLPPETTETSTVCRHRTCACSRAQAVKTLVHTAEAVEQGITINSLEWLGSIYKHVEMLFTMSDWIDYTSTQTSEGNTLNIHNVYTGREKEGEREAGFRAHRSARSLSGMFYRAK